MAMTVSKLIKELQKIENKFLEVEFLCRLGMYELVELDRIQKVDKKVIIYSSDK